MSPDTRPDPLPWSATCDWGNCDNPSICIRLSTEDDAGWVPVCIVHATDATDEACEHIHGDAPCSPCYEARANCECPWGCDCPGGRGAMAQPVITHHFDAACEECRLRARGYVDPALTQPQPDTGLREAALEMVAAASSKPDASPAPTAAPGLDWTIVCDRHRAIGFHGAVVGCPDCGRAALAPSTPDEEATR